MKLRETPQTYGSREPVVAIPLHEVGYTAKDLALCSTEEARALLPFDRAQMLQVLPLAVVHRPDGKKLHCVALSDSAAKQREVRFATGTEAFLTRVPQGLFKEALIQAYLGSDTRLEESFARIARDKAAPQSCPTVPPKPQGEAACFLQSLLEYGVVRGATDIHLSPKAEGALIKLRIDGALLQHSNELYARTFHEQIVNRLKVLANLDISSKLLPQDGAFVARIAEFSRHVRVSILPSVFGESVVLRLIGASEQCSLSRLGIEPVTLHRIREVMNESEQGGLILLTGPTGSGKTTTMYSIVSDLDTRGLHVVTIEDPVETHLGGPLQIQVRNEQGFSFAKAVRSLLRHDPDVALIGEIRDAESARIALEVASTGHLTLSSLHISSALQAVARLRILGISPRESAAAVLLVLNQRLLPRLCRKCRRKDTQAAGVQLYTSDGCMACGGTGHSGLVLVTELLDLRSHEAKEAFSIERPVSELVAALSSSAYLPFGTSLQHHLAEGDISWAQVQEFVDYSMPG
jgi:type IV pilus assembly protein PilB